MIEWMIGWMTHNGIWPKKKKLRRQNSFMISIDRSIGNKQKKKIIDCCCHRSCRFFLCWQSDYVEIFFVLFLMMIMLLLLSMIRLTMFGYQKSKENKQKANCIVFDPPTHFSLLFNGDIFVHSLMIFLEKNLMTFASLSLSIITDYNNKHS